MDEAKQALINALALLVSNNQGINAMNYRQTGSDSATAYSKWRKECPLEKHHVVSFVAGYNAALANEFTELAVRHLTSILRDDMTTSEIKLGDKLVEMGLCYWQEDDFNHWASLERK